MIESYQITQSINHLANRLESRAKLLRLAAGSNNKLVIDWEVIVADLNEGFDTVMGYLGFDVDTTDVDDELDQIEGEELDIERHPLDPDLSDPYLSHVDDEDWDEGVVMDDEA